MKFVTEIKIECDDYLKAFSELNFDFSPKRDVAGQRSERVGGGVDGEQAGDLRRVHESPSSMSKFALTLYSWH